MKGLGLRPYIDNMTMEIKRVNTNEDAMNKIKELDQLMNNFTQDENNYFVKYDID